MKTRGRRGLRVSAGIMLLALAAWVSRVGATHSLLEHVSQGALNGNGPHAAVFVGASTDGSHVFFLTAEALADTDTDTAFDLYERAGGQTTHVSQGEINGNSSTAFVSYLGASADGSRVFFGTAEPLVSGDTDTRTDIYERFQGQTTQVSAGNGAVDVTYQAASADGTHVFFTTTESLMVSDTDVNRIDIYERDHGALVHVTEARQPGAFPEDALFRGISVDGTHVFFDTFEEVLASDDETGGAATDVYERFGGQTFHVTIGSNALRSCTFVGASADGSRVFFATNDSFDSVTDTDTTGDIYERFAGGTFHVSQGAINGNGPEAVTFVDASADGTRVVFKTLERLAATDSDNAEDLYERAGGQTLHVTRGAINGNGTPPCFFLGASADGSRIFFSTTEQLDSTDTDASIDVYERVAAMTTTQVSRGDVNGNLAFHATFKAASADGTRVFFETSEVLAATDADGSVDIYERAEGQTTQVSSGNGPQGPTFAGKSLDGGHVFFTSVERLAGTDTDDSSDIYDAHVLTGPADLIFGDGFEAGAPSAG